MFTVLFLVLNVFQTFDGLLIIARVQKQSATDRPTAQLSVRPTYRVEFPRLKMELDLDPFAPSLINSFFIHLTLTSFDVIDSTRFNDSR